MNIQKHIYHWPFIGYRLLIFIFLTVQGGIKRMLCFITADIKFSITFITDKHYAVIANSV